MGVREQNIVHKIIKPVTNSFQKQRMTEPDTDDVNNIVLDYLSVVTPNLAKKFRKDVNILGDLPTGSPRLSDIVEHFKGGAVDTKKGKEKKRKAADEILDSNKEIKKVKNLSSGSSVNMVSLPTQRKKIFIRNVGKESVYEDFQES